MSQPSQWPLTFDAVRFLTPRFMLDHLASYPLTRNCYPTALGFYPRAMGHSVHRPVHDDDLVLYCTSGSGCLETSDFKGDVQTGDLILLPRGISHHYRASSRTPWTLYWVHLSGLHVKDYFDQLDFSPDKPVVHVGVSANLITDFKRLINIRESGYQHSVYNFAASLLQQILSSLVLEARNATAVNKHKFDLDRIQQIMKENLDSNIDLDTLAGSVNLSRYHFVSKYKRLTGYSPIRHYIHMKIERACRLLDTTPSSVKAISHQLGYRDPLHFSRQFRKITGNSPSGYRRRT